MDIASLLSIKMTLMDFFDAALLGPCFDKQIQSYERWHGPNRTHLPLAEGGPQARDFVDTISNHIINL